MKNNLKWIIETEPKQLGGEKTDFSVWLKVNYPGQGHIHVQFPHWFGEERCKELAQSMCDGMNAATKIHEPQPFFSSKHPEGRSQ